MPPGAVPPVPVLASGTGVGRMNLLRYRRRIAHGEDHQHHTDRPLPCPPRGPHGLGIATLDGGAEDGESLAGGSPSWFYGRGGPYPCRSPSASGSTSVSSSSLSSATSPSVSSAGSWSGSNAVDMASSVSAPASADAVWHEQPHGRRQNLQSPLH